MIKSNYQVNEPIILYGKHRTQGSITEFIPDGDELIIDLCRKGVLKKLGSVSELTEPFIKREPLKPVVIEDKAGGKEEFNARDSRRLDSHSNTKKKSK